MLSTCCKSSFLEMLFLSMVPPDPYAGSLCGALDTQEYQRGAPFLRQETCLASACGGAGGACGRGRESAADRVVGAGFQCFGSRQGAGTRGRPGRGPGMR